MLEETETLDRRRLLLPSLAGVYSATAPLAYAFIRVVSALDLLPGGIDKLLYGGAARIAVGNVTALGLPYPYAWSWAVAIIEFFGSMLLAVGLFTRPVAFAFVVMLSVIAFGIMIQRGLFWATGGLEVALLLDLVCFGFVLGGGGRYSVDRLIGREF